jgi:hypothetical protein
VERQACAGFESYEDNPFVVFEIQSQDLNVDARPDGVLDPMPLTLASLQFSAI